jgi:hypothetical protein
VGAWWEVGGSGRGRGRERGDGGGGRGLAKEVERVCGGGGGGCGLSPHVAACTAEPLSTLGLILFVARTLTPERK